MEAQHHPGPPSPVQIPVMHPVFNLMAIPTGQKLSPGAIVTCHPFPTPQPPIPIPLSVPLLPVLGPLNQRSRNLQIESALEYCRGTDPPCGARMALRCNPGRWPDVTRSGLDRLIQGKATIISKKIHGNHRSILTYQERTELYMTMGAAADN
jgi:hypothetical protein